MKGSGGKLFARMTLVGTMMFTLLGIGIASLIQASPTVYAAKNATNTCDLEAPGGTVKHVIYVAFDNVHLTRDNPNVPSDLEQMPNLLNFLKNNGTVLANNHTPSDRPHRRRSFNNSNGRLWRSSWATDQQ